MSIEDIKRTWEVEAYVQDATRSDVVHWIVTLQDKITQLERVNKEWEALWEPIDDLVRPVTPLGGSVSDKAVELINDTISSLSPEFEDGVEFEGWELRSGDAPIIEDGRYD